MASVKHFVRWNTDRGWKTGGPYLLLLTRQGPVHFHYGNVVLKKTESRRMAIVLSKNWGMRRQPAEVLVTYNLSRNHKDRGV